jgi:hypothetical protein
MKDDNENILTNFWQYVEKHQEEYKNELIKWKIKTQSLRLKYSIGEIKIEEYDKLDLENYTLLIKSIINKEKIQ